MLLVIIIIIIIIIIMQCLTRHVSVNRTNRRRVVEYLCTKLDVDNSSHFNRPVKFRAGVSVRNIVGGTVIFNRGNFYSFFQSMHTQQSNKNNQYRIKQLDKHNVPAYM